MAIVKRGKTYYAYFKPYRAERVGIKLDAGTKSEARQIEGLIMRACRTGDFSTLDPVAREAVVRMHENQGWELPDGLAPEAPQSELTLWKACELFMKYPGIGDGPGRWRHEIALTHMVEVLGKDMPVKSIWVPTLKQYQTARLAKGAAPDTVNREMSTVSRLFGTLLELQLVEHNPCRLLKRLSAKSGERQVYISREDIQRLHDECPPWTQPVILAAYMTGARLGELLNLRRSEVNLAKRMITLSPNRTKEGHWKKIPVHRELVPVIEDALRVTSMEHDLLFLQRDHRGIRSAHPEALKSAWQRACKRLGFEKPWPRFHDLRHTWRTNARRSRLDYQVAEAIMGHQAKVRSVADRYGVISDEELLEAIDQMTFDHGETEILVAGHGQRFSGDTSNIRGNKNATFVAPKKKGHAAT